MRYLALLALLLVAACAAPSTAAASAGPDDLVLRLRTTGGLLPVGAALPGAPVPNRPANCLTVDAATVRPAIDQANAATPWRSAGTLWSVRFRPLLPDESSCDDLRA